MQKSYKHQGINRTLRLSSWNSKPYIRDVAGCEQKSETSITEVSVILLIPLMKIPGRFLMHVLHIRWRKQG